MKKIHFQIQNKGSIRSFEQTIFNVRISRKISTASIQVTQWRAQFLSNASTLFEKGRNGFKTEEETEKDKLLKTIGKRKVEVGFLKKRLAIENLEEKRKMIRKDYPKLSVFQQCFLLFIHSRLSGVSDFGFRWEVKY